MSTKCDICGKEVCHDSSENPGIPEYDVCGRCDSRVCPDCSSNIREEFPVCIHCVKRHAVSEILSDHWVSFGMDKPSNHDQIAEFCYKDIEETADPKEWHNGDVTIALRRWIESKEE